MESPEVSPQEPTASREDFPRLPAVDEVLDEVSALDEQPVEQHVEVFQRAHEQLRRALDAQPEG